MYEKIKAEIEQRKATAKILIQHPDDADYRNGVLDALDGIFAFVESLEKKQPQGLDEAVEELYPDFSDDFASKAAIEAVRNAFKAGAAWRDSQIPELLDNVDEAAKKYANENSFMVFNPVEGCDCPFDEEKVIEIFKAGAEWHSFCS